MADLPVDIRVDVEKVEPTLTARGSFGLPLARLDICRGGRRVTVHVVLVGVERQGRTDLQVRMTSVGRISDHEKTMFVYPWTREEVPGG